MGRIAFAPDPDLSFWPTPDDVADSLLDYAMAPWMADGRGVRVLEPSAGAGHLAAAVRRCLPRAHITCVEPAPERTALLRASAVADVVVEATLEDYLDGGDLDGPYDLVIANPPYKLPGRPRAWAEHILALWGHPDVLAPFAILTAVLPRIVMMGRHPQVKAVRDAVHGCMAADGVQCAGLWEMPRGAFDSVGAAVSAAGIWMQRDAAEAAS